MRPPECEGDLRTEAKWHRNQIKKAMMIDQREKVLLTKVKGGDCHVAPKTTRLSYLVLAATSKVRKGTGLRPIGMV